MRLHRHSVWAHGGKRACCFAPADIPQLITSPETAGYIKVVANDVVIEPANFAAALKSKGPLPAQEWLKPELGETPRLRGGTLVLAQILLVNVSE
jgi:hypothetical protein